jgi:hypothetical protein
MNRPDWQCIREIPGHINPDIIHEAMGGSSGLMRNMNNTALPWGSAGYRTLDNEYGRSCL